MSTTNELLTRITELSEEPTINHNEIVALQNQVALQECPLEIGDLLNKKVAKQYARVSRIVFSKRIPFYEIYACMAKNGSVSEFYSNSMPIKLSGWEKSDERP